MINMTVFKYALLGGLTKPMSIVMNSIVPIILTIFSDRVNPGFGGGNREFYLLAFVVMFGAFLMANSIQKDKVEGVLVRILAGPVTLRSYLMQNFLAAIVPMSIVSAIIGLLGYVIHDWAAIFTIGLVLCYIMVSASAIGLSFVWSCLFKDKEASLSGISILLTLTALIGGFMLPLSILPTAVYYIGALFPAHWASRSLEQLVVYGQLTTMYWLGILAVGMFAVAFVLYGSKRRLV